MSENDHWLGCVVLNIQYFSAHAVYTFLNKLFIYLSVYLLNYKWLSLMKPQSLVVDANIFESFSGKI